MKAQIKFEFIFAVFIFAVLIFLVGFYINISISTSLTDTGLDSLKSKAATILEILAKNKGEPENWETLPNAKRPGLAYSPYNLSMQKISALNSNCELIETLGIEDYKLTIKKSGAEILSCGYETPGKMVINERAVFIEDGHGTISIELW